MSALRFALRTLARELRAGELSVLAFALVVAVGAVAAVGMFTDRVAGAMARQAGDILAADLVVHAGAPLEPRLADEARARGLATSARWSFASVVLAGDASALANVNAVAPGYPLRGTVDIADVPFGARRAADGIPARGTVWLDVRLLAQLGLDVGDAVQVGEAALTVAHVLERIPDAGFGFTSLAPTLLMNLDDVAATRLIQPGSRVRYRLLVAGARDALAAYAEWAGPQLRRGDELVDVRDERPQIGTALDRADRFLGLAAIVAVLLAAVAVAMAARRYAARHLDAIAVIKSLGGSQRFVLGAHALQVLVVGVAGAALGIALGWLAQLALVELMRGLLAVSDLPAPGAWPAAVAAATGLVVLAGFALPPLLPLRRVPPARVLRRDLGPPPLSGIVAYGAAVAVVAGLLYAHTGDWRLTAIAGVGAVVAAAVFGVAAWLALTALARVRGRVGVAWRYGLANIVRRRRDSVAQLVAFGLGLTVLIVLGIVRSDLMERWSDTLTADAPNHFLINIQTDERATLERVFRDAGVEPPVLYPMVRARLSHIRGTPVADIDFEGRGRFMADREQNLSWAETPQADNRVVAGAWWDASRHGEPLISLEVEAAQRLGVAVGDELTFDVAGESLTVTVANTRTVDWDSFNPNFFMVLPPGVLDGLPASWVGATRVAPQDRGVFLDLLRALPTVTVIDIEAVLAQVRSVVAQASRAVEFVFVFTLVAGFAVMLAAIAATRDERRREGAMLRTFGAARGVVLRGLVAEFAVLGAVAGLLAAVAANAIGALLASQVFEFPYAGSALTWLAGVVGGALMVGGLGVAATRGVLDEPPLGVLNRA